MKHKKLLNDETNSFSLASTESRSILLGEEASSNRDELYYENQKNLLKAHFERKKQKSNQLVSSVLKTPRKQQSYQPVLSKNFPKTAPPRLETDLPVKKIMSQQPSLIKEVSALSNNSRSSRNSSIRYSAREKTIIEWAFKRFEEEVDVEKIEKEKKKKKTGRFVHEFWYENDEEILNGSPNRNNSICLTDSNEKDDFDFYRTNRKAVTTKTDIEINRQSKQLGTRLIDLSKERYKVIGILDYEKKKFVRNQLLKSESLPGLRCFALMNENPHYRFRRPGNVKSFDKFHKNPIEFSSVEPTVTHLPDINQLTNELSTNKQTTDKPIEQIVALKENDHKNLKTSLNQANQSSEVYKSSNNIKNKENKMKPAATADKPIEQKITLKENKTFLVQDIQKTHSLNKPAEALTSVARPKTGLSDRNKVKHSASKNIETSIDSFESASVLKDLLNNSSQLLMPTIGAETLKIKKSILKQPGLLSAVVPQKSIMFAEEKANEIQLLETNLADKRAKTASQKRFDPLKKENEKPLSSIEIMMGTDIQIEDDHASEDSVTSFNPADTLVTNEAINNINEQTLTANIKLVNDFKDLEEQSFDLINPINEEINQSLVESFINARATNVSSLSAPNATLNAFDQDDSSEQFMNHSSDDININSKRRSSNHKVSFKLSTEKAKDSKTVNKKTLELPIVKKHSDNIASSMSTKAIEKKEIPLSNTSNNNNTVISLFKAPVKTDPGSKLKENEKLEVYQAHIQTTPGYTSLDISPIQDNRFRDLISIVKPAFILKEMKDVKKIIEKNDALKSINIDVEMREKMNKVKERGSKLAVKARAILASGEYNYHLV